MSLVAHLPRVGSLLAVPLVLFLLVFFVAPAGVFLAYSFFESGVFTIEPAFVFENYAALAGDATFHKVLVRTFIVAFCASAVTVAIGLPVAYYITFHTRTNVLMYFIVLSLFSSYLVRVYAWRTILGSNGMLNTALDYLGLIDEPIKALLFNPLAVTITLVHIWLPFTLLVLLAALRDVRAELLEAAEDLGATFRRALMRVLVPMASPGIIRAFMFTFALAAGDYVTPQLVGGPSGMTVGLLISNQFVLSGNWPAGAAMSFFMLFVFLAIYLGLIQLSRSLRLAPKVRWH